jgi:hypothetical protein
MILALDVSSSKTGICFMNTDGTLYKFLYIDTQTNTKAKKQKFSDIYDKIKEVVNYFENYYKDNPDSPKISEIHIEGPLSKYSPGRSSIHTLEVLFQMNYSVSFELYKIFGIKPVHWHPTTLRSHNGIKIPRGEDTKLLIYKFVCEKFPEFASKCGEFSKTSPWVDVADSVVIARGAWLHKNSPIIHTRKNATNKKNN